MLLIYPKLRSVVVPTLFSYNRLRIFDDDDRRIAALFKDAFRVKRDLQHDSEAYIEYRRNLFNEPFSLEQGLPIKIRYIPDCPKPILLMSLNHTVADGMGWLHMVDSLMAYLNGKRPHLVPLDNPSLMPSLLEPPYYKVPIKFYKSLNIYARDAYKLTGKTIIPASSRPANFFGPLDLQHHTLSYDLASIKSRSKTFGCSITVLLSAALAISLSRRYGKDMGDVIGIPVQVDLRPYFDGEKPIFGNYLRASMITIHRKDWEDRSTRIIKMIETQLTQQLRQIKNKEILFPLLIEKINTLMGKKNYARFVRMLRRKRKLCRMTSSISNIGNTDGMNSHGAKAQVCEVISTTQYHGLLLSFSSIDGQINTVFSYPEAEFSREEIQDLIRSFEQALGELLEG